VKLPEEEYLDFTEEDVAARVIRGLSPEVRRRRVERLGERGGLFGITEGRS
jgi:hypothetical protein